MLTFQTRDKLNIHFIGAGGTGSYAIPYLVRLLADNEHKLTIYDGDKVEPKNLKRQNFQMSDLDLNKAEALAGQLESIPHSLTIRTNSNYISDKDEFLAELLCDLEDDESLVIVMAVDNVATRKLINEAVMTDLVTAGIPTIVLDCGNHIQGGQVVLYGNAETSYAPPLKAATRGMLPSMLQLYPEIDRIEDENPGLVQNCVENAESEPQAMMSNVRNGELLAHIVNQIYENHKVYGNLWKSDLLTGSTIASFTGFLGGENK